MSIALFQPVLSVVDRTILETCSWNGCHEWMTGDRRRAVMKASTFGLFHLAWVLFLSCGGAVLLFVLPSWRPAMANLVYLCTAYTLSLKLTPQFYHGMAMGLAFWIAGLSFAPCPRPWLALIVNIVVMHYQDVEYIRFMILVFTLRRVGSVPRLWDINPCSLVSAFIVFSSIAGVAIHVLTSYVPQVIIPFMVMPTYTFTDQFSPRVSLHAVNACTSLAPLAVLVLLGRLTTYGEEDETAPRVG